MEAKHTPGPWTAHHEPSLNRFAIRAEPFGTRTILSVSYWERTLPWNRELAEANARLIAAAPDHYTNARELVRMADEGYSLRDADGAQHPEWEYLLENAREAIAKAEGGGE